MQENKDRRVIDAVRDIKVSSVTGVIKGLFKLAFFLFAMFCVVLAGADILTADYDDGITDIVFSEFGFGVSYIVLYIFEVKTGKMREFLSTLYK